MQKAAKFVILAAAAIAIRGEPPAKQTIAPHELNEKDAPAAILVEPVPPPKKPTTFDSAEEPNLRLNVVARGLQQPWGIAFLPDGQILVTERAGRVRVIRGGKLLPDPVTGVPEVFNGGPRGLQGLMDITLHPRFQKNHWVYLTYHKPTASGGGETVLARATWDGKALMGTQDIFNSKAEDTEASRIAFGRDGMLYMSISAPGSPKVNRAQDPMDYAGKTVRLRDDGTIPPGNPFAGRAGYLPAIFTLGHRNGHGMAVNPETGDLWESEQGPNGGDELNILHAGRNYGWPLVSFGRDYWGQPVSKQPSRAGMEDPVVVWLPSIGITGMTFYTGDRFPHWKRNLLVGGLREGGIPGTGQIQRIVFNERWQELRREPMLMNLKQRIRDVAQSPDGLIYVLTAEEDGVVLRIEPAEKK